HARTSRNLPVHAKPSASSHGNCTTPRRFLVQFGNATRYTIVQPLFGTCWRQPLCCQQQPPPFASTSTAAKFKQSTSTNLDANQSMATPGRQLQLNSSRCYKRHLHSQRNWSNRYRLSIPRWHCNRWYWRLLIHSRPNIRVQANVETANTSHVNWFATPETDSDKLTQVYLSVSQPRTKGPAAAPREKVKQLWRPTKTPPPADHTVTGPCLTPPETLAWAR
ncbi:hypothetical protein Taro_005417, partial [Colocasia esculenta]|nr:hypothetical protein [Colocasia esculenta]